MLVMNILLVLILLAANCILLSHGELFEDSPQKKVDILKYQIKTVNKMLNQSCLSYSRIEEETLEESHVVQLKYYKNLYIKLLTELRKCKKSSISKKTTMNVMKSTPPKNTLAITKSKTTTPASTPTIPSIPKECLQARNLTEFWRRDEAGSNYKPGGLYSSNGYNCDLHINLPAWFRFTGKGGNRMLDRCPAKYSCGTETPIWTDGKMPQDVGVETIVNAYGVEEVKENGLLNLFGLFGRTSRDCKRYQMKLKVMRCSLDSPDDFIYLQTHIKNPCTEGYCGMI